MSELIDAAIEYLGRGLSVIALTGKTPNTAVHRQGLHNALSGQPESSEDFKLLADIFAHPETTGIGILTNWPLVVVDIDGEVGAQEWKALVGNDEYMPERWVAKTGRGLHLYFGSTEPVNTFKAGTLLDVKGNGGYVAAPPSAHPGGHRYEWLLPPEGSLLEVPAALATRISQVNYDREAAIVGRSMRKRIRHQPYEGARLWVSFGFDHLFDGLRAAGEGNRNNYLHWAAATMAEEGATDEEFGQLRSAALEIGLTPIEVTRTIRSGRAV